MGIWLKGGKGMKKVFQFAIVALVVCGVTAITPVVAFASFTLIPPDQTFAGKTYGQWSESWWQWAALPSAHQSPIADKNGKDCAVGQRVDSGVWFLAGTTGGSQRVTRICTVPSNLGIFFPIINAECSSVEGNGTNYGQLSKCAKGIIDHVTVAQASVDGVALPIGPVTTSHFRVLSPQPPFPITFGSNNVFSVPAGSGISVSDGFWVLLAPLPPGQHTVSIDGVAPFPEATPPFTFEVHVTYNLTVQ
jgi:hypothetical protein